MLQSSYAEKAPHSQGTVHRVFSGKTGLADMLTFCQGNCSPRQTKEVKLLYRRYKEGSYSVVEFLRGADTIMGNEPLVRSMLAQRSSCSEDRVGTQLERNTLLGEKNGKSLLVTAERELYPDRASMKVENGRESIAAPSTEVVSFENSDVYKEADDVLATAGVDTDDEARQLLFADSPRLQRAIEARKKFKKAWRKSIELCIFARVYAMNKAASFGETLHIDCQVYGYLEDALQVRLRNFISRVLICATRRTGSQQNAFEKSTTVFEPKQRIRQVNVDAERSKNERFEKERQALLRFGETILVKRKRVFHNSRLEDKVAKVRQEEEERIRADVANKAARNALGEAKYLKWYDMASQSKVDSSSKFVDAPKTSQDVEMGFIPQVFERRNQATSSIVLRDCHEALVADVRGAALRS
mmetsp:Transcript_13555/g.59203  ORF Transcript_13555/g.59203 Transcript_13555/m.59203 type:complete len:414 (-) Transcript_13555:325-1566(-)